LLCLTPFLQSAGVPVKRSPDEVLVIFNENSPISRDVAHDYAFKRKVTHLLAIKCPDAAVDSDAETIPMDAYKKTVETPVLAYLSQHKGINFIVTTKGVPLRIEGAETGQRSVDSAATAPLTTSLDSHLAALGYPALPGFTSIKITGSGATGIGWSNRYWNANEPFSHDKFGGYLVTRLDGYTKANAKALVTRALAAEQTRPTGKFLFDIQPIFGLGDTEAVPAPIKGTVIPDEYPWDEYNAEMRRGYDLLKARNIPAELDLTERFVGQHTGLAGYFSWGSNDAKFSNSAYQSLTFAPGSIGDTAVSTSGRTFLPTEGGQSLIADLIAHGITCVKGDTDEPLLQANAAPAILLERYTSGYTMAESFYMASRFVSWQDVIIGDPLCAPYAKKSP
jgi:uncharacterized protein (TIGR03790 family)